LFLTTSDGYDTIGSVTSGQRRLLRIVLTAFAVTCAVAAALIFARAAYAWYTTKYEDAASHPPGYMVSTCCQADRLWNKVWRPSGIQFCLHEPPYNVSYVCSFWDNPIVDERDAFNSWAHCLNNDTVSSYPTTCQTTHP
jgi:hypothetical protein